MGAGDDRGIRDIDSKLALLANDTVRCALAFGTMRAQRSIRLPENGLK